MTLDGGIHHLGTKPEHLLIPIGIGIVGILGSFPSLEAVAVGMLLVLVFGNVRAGAPSYRWRVREQEPEGCE